MKKFKTKKEALEWCFSQTKYSIIGEDYNKMKQYKYRFEKTPETFKETAIQTVFEYFGIQEHCSYSVDPSKAKYNTEK